MKIPINIVHYTDDPYCTVVVQLGKFALNIYEGADYRRDEILGGTCDVSFPKEAELLVQKHNLSSINKDDNNVLFNEIYKVLIDEDEEGFTTLDQRSAEVIKEKYNIGGHIKEIKQKELDVKEDKPILGLFSDPAFISKELKV